MTIVLNRVGALGLIACGCLGACSSQRAANVTIDNTSAAALQVEVTMPARGVFGRKPNHEGFVNRVEPGASWQSTADTRRWSMDSNPQQAFRVVAAEHDASPPVVYEAVWFDTGNTACHLVFRGRGGAISCQAITASGSAAGPEQVLRVRQE